MYPKEEEKPKELLHPGYKLTVCYDCGSYVKLYRREDNAFEGTCCGSQIVVLPGNRNPYIPNKYYE
jgi:hypothetical protein